MKPIKLERTVTVHTFDTEATVAIARERPEWLAVAKLAQDFGGEITPEAVTRELLAGVHPAVGQRAIQRCIALGLLEWKQDTGTACLSALGRVSLEQGRVFVSETRCWRFYYVDDPLIEQGLLHVEPLDVENAQEERHVLRQAKENGHRRPEQGAETPSLLLEVPEHFEYLDARAEGASAFKVVHMGGSGEPGEDCPLRLQLTWQKDGVPALELRGKLPRPEYRPRRDSEKESQAVTPPDATVDVSIEIPEILSQLGFNSLWLILVFVATKTEFSVLRKWREQAGRLVCPTVFESATEAARRGFVSNLSVPKVPRFPKLDLGEFDPSVLHSVEHVPASEADAQQWADWLLQDSLTDYATPPSLRQLAEATRKRFEFHSPTLPSPEQLLEAALGKPQDAKSHLILAPYDLGLWS